MGRPNKGRTGAQFHLRLAPAEKRQLEDAARALGLQTSVWARDTLLHQAQLLLDAASHKKAT